MTWLAFTGSISSLLSFICFPAGSMKERTPVLSFITPAWNDDYEAWIPQVRGSAVGGANIVQIRDKGASSELLRKIGVACVSAVKPFPCRVVINANCDADVDAAVECGAHGVHIPEWRMDRVPQALQALQERDRSNVVGVSVHSVAAAIKAARLGASYIQVGTMFPTASHPEKGERVEGPRLMKKVSSALSEAGLRHRVSLIGVGGIDIHNCRQVIDAGADGVAVIGALAKAHDPSAVARGLLTAMQGGA